MLAVEKRWQRILGSVLETASVEAAEAGSGADLLVRTRGDRAIAFKVKWAGEGWPQDVRRVAAEVEGRWPADLVLLARRLSPGAIEWLRDRGANWADEAGQARIIGPDGLIVIREPAKLPPAEGTAATFAWSESAIAIAEAILAHEDRPLRVVELAQVSGWSNAQAAKILRAFDGQGWTAKRGAARGASAYRELIDANGMLAAWSAALADTPHPARIAHRVTKDPLAFLHEELAPALERSVRWAVSGWAGLSLTAPFATTMPALHLYVADTEFAGPLSEAIEEAGLREVEEGGVVSFWAAGERLFRFSRQIEGLPVVSAPRLFADLSSFGARGGDAADHVKEELIDPLHHGRPIGKGGGHG
ncbi:MAG TPA: hypothetical protein VG963_34415 [Polyangiaceae bacterium]|nr:hypothetical protein [Polyangiaceae bacterium]